MCNESKCENPAELKGKPGECSTEQIKECHGDEEGHVCVPENEVECEYPEKLDGKPDDCSSEQVEECHGDEEEHSCM